MKTAWVVMGLLVFVLAVVPFVGCSSSGGDSSYGDGGSGSASTMEKDRYVCGCGKAVAVGAGSEAPVCCGAAMMKVGGSK